MHNFSLSSRPWSLFQLKLVNLSVCVLWYIQAFCLGFLCRSGEGWMVVELQKGEQINLAILQSVPCFTVDLPNPRGLERVLLQLFSYQISENECSCCPKKLKNSST